MIRKVPAIYLFGAFLFYFEKSLLILAAIKPRTEMQEIKELTTDNLRNISYFSRTDDGQSIIKSEDDKYILFAPIGRVIYNNLHWMVYGELKAWRVIGNNPLTVKRLNFIEKFIFILRDFKTL